MPSLPGMMPEVRPPWGSGIAIARHASMGTTFPFDFLAGDYFHILGRKGAMVELHSPKYGRGFQLHYELAESYFTMPEARTAWDWLNGEDPFSTVVTIRAAGVNVRTPMVIARPKLERLEGPAPTGRTAWQWLDEE